MKNNFSKVLCLLLALMLLLTACGKPVPPDEPEPTEEVPHSRPEYALTDAPVFKEESVYVNLSPDGTVQSVSVTDRLHTDMPQVRIEDVSDLTDIQDVKTFAEPIVQDGKLYWDMEYTDLYYSGQSSATPPVNISLSYKLDGKDIDYRKLAGKSGRVEITVKVENTLEKQVTVNGTSYTVKCPMLFVGGTILPDDGFSDVKAENAVIMGDGLHKIVFFAGIPGMNDSLDIQSLAIPLLGQALESAEYTITAEVENFAMSNMMFAALPFSSLASLGAASISEGMDGVKEVLTDLDTLLGGISSLNVTQMIGLLYGNSDNAVKLLNAVGEAAKLYEENRALLETLDKYVTEDNLALVKKTLADLEKLDPDTLSTVVGSEEFRQLMQMLGELDGASEAVSELTNDAMLLLPIAESLKADLSAEAVNKSLQSLPQTVQKLRELVALMEQSRGLLDTLGSLFEGGSAAQLQRLMSIAEKYTRLDSLSTAQSEHLAGRMSEWLSFGSEYSIFTQRTENMTSSVMFIFKTEGIG